jgi:hypothetical protein
MPRTYAMLGPRDPKVVIEPAGTLVPQSLTISRRIGTVTSVKARDPEDGQIHIVGWIARCYGNQAGNLHAGLCNSNTFMVHEYTHAVTWLHTIHVCRKGK